MGMDRHTKRLTVSLNSDPEMAFFFMSSNAFRTARARYAALTRSRPGNDSELLASRRLMREQALIEAIERAVQGGPPITDELRRRIAALLADSPVVA
jgi:hypothetical protein